MSRREQPLEQGGGVLAQFAGALRLLRDKAGGPTYRELGHRAHYSASTLSDAASGKKFPTLAVTLGYVRACGGDAADWEQRWRVAAAALTATSERLADARDGGPQSPYVGLAAFQADDADRFFGRERLVERLVGRLAQRRFLAVFGPSGSGKSSLLRAGLLPRLREGQVRDVLFTPGPHPLEECAVRLAALIGTTAGQLHADLRAEPRNLLRAVRQILGDEPGELILVVDQFEEIFTLCADRDERVEFLDALLLAATDDGSRCRVVVGMRADFYSHCADHPILATALSDAQVLVGPLTTAELRDVVVKPAARKDCTVEGALVAHLVAECDGRAGILPLLSHALFETWRRRSGNRLSLSGYQATGGISGALARTADEQYAAMGPDEKYQTEQLFLRLTAVGDGTEDTKRRIRRDELDETAPGLDVVLGRLADARLIILDAESVEIAHESLIKAWPRLGEWLAMDRDGLRVHRQITEAVTAWEGVDRDPGGLARGTRLAIAQEWAERADRALTPREREFLRASIDAAHRERRTTRRRTQQLRWLSVSLTALLIGAVALAGVALLNQRSADEQRQIAQSRQFAAQADALAGQDPGQAMKLSLEAQGAYSTAESRSSVLSMAGRPASHGLIHASGFGVGGAALSADGRWLAAQDTNNNVVIWDVPQRRQIATLHPVPPTPGLPFAAAFSEDGKHLVTMTTSKVLVLWDLATPGRPTARVTSDTEGRGVAFSPDGTRVATIDGDQNLEIRDGATLRLLSRAPGATAGQSSGLGTVAYSPDGQTLATTAGLDQVQLRDPGTGVVRATLHSSAYAGRPLAFSPDGKRLAAPDTVGGIAIWDVATHKVTSSVKNIGIVSELAFDSRTGRLLVAGTSGLRVWNGDLSWSILLTADFTKGLAAANGTIITEGTAGILVWDVAKLPVLNFDRTDDIAFDPRGAAVITAGGYAVPLKQWQVDSPHTENDLIKTNPGMVIRSRLSRDGSQLAVMQSSGALFIYDVATGTRLTELATPTGESGTSLVFSSDGRNVAANYSAAAGRPAVPHTIVWDIATRRAIADLPVNGRHLAFSPDRRQLAVDDGHSLASWDLVSQTRTGEFPFYPGRLSILSYSPDGRLLVAGQDSKVGLWDTERFQHLADLVGHSGIVDVLAFSPSGRFLATAGTDAKVVIWDVAAREPWATLTGAGPSNTAMAWNSKETVLATASLDGIVSLWPVDIGKATQQLCNTLATDFPTTEDAAPAPPNACPQDVH